MKTEWLTECAYTDEQDTLHIDVPRMLRVLGLPDTPENREAGCEQAAKILQELLKDTPAVIKITK